MQNSLGRGFFMEPHIATIHGNQQGVSYLQSRGRNSLLQLVTIYLEQQEREDCCRKFEQH